MSTAAPCVGVLSLRVTVAVKTALVGTVGSTEAERMVVRLSTLTPASAAVTAAYRAVPAKEAV